MNNTLGSRISEYRKRLSITQDQLAEHMNVSPQAVSKWENDLSCPDISLLPQLADYFNITIDELLRGDTQREVRIVPQAERKDFTKMLLKVNVNSSSGDIVKVNLPLPLVKVAIEVGMQLPEISGNDVLKNIDFASILMMAESGVIGKLVEVQTSNGDNIDIVIE